MSISHFPSCLHPALQRHAKAICSLFWFFGNALNHEGRESFPVLATQHLSDVWPCSFHVSSISFLVLLFRTSLLLFRETKRYYWVSPLKPKQDLKSSQFQRVTRQFKCSMRSIARYQQPSHSHSTLFARLWKHEKGKYFPFFLQVSVPLPSPNVFTHI